MEIELTLLLSLFNLLLCQSISEKKKPPLFGSRAVIEKDYKIFENPVFSSCNSDSIVHLVIIEVSGVMALRRMLGYSDGELMRSDAKPCTRLMRQTAGIFSVGGALGFWILCRLHYGPRITVPRSLRWATCGAVTVSSSTALLVRLFSPECEPQNIAAYDKKG
ncbi:hypothetical protein AABB24_005952 [Solanum stoloniferum]|uniref:DUF7875 domain-containing protein n=1 Tax=Solanum stoloniferum TaxID=62892 RepID=A0ABD2V081_9SOLN